CMRGNIAASGIDYW
nr:immunoglobulin heavy chain junction region [Macaca mulatta]